MTGSKKTSGITPFLKKDWQKKISFLLTMMLLLGMVLPAWATTNVWIEGLGYNNVSGSVYGTVYTDTYGSVSSGVYAAVYCDPATPNYSPLLSWTSVDGTIYKTDVFDVPRPQDMPSHTVHAVVYDSNMSSVLSSTYNLDVPSNNANLSSLVLSAGVLNPSFDASTTGYTAGVDNSVSGITVTATAADTNATIKVNGTVVPSGQASGSINLNVGDNTITIEVDAQDNLTIKSYTVVVTRAAASGGGGGSTTTTTTDVAANSGVNAATGGTVSNSDGSVSVNIPAGGLSSDGKVSITEVTGSAVPPAGVNLIMGDKVFNITLEVASLTGPVTLTLKYDTAKFANVQADKIGLYYYNESRKTWLHIGGNVDTVNGTVTVEVTHFTKFAIMANPNLPTLKDIDTHWAKKDIKHLVGLLAINGYPDGTFKPDNSITRAEFATILAKAMGWTANAGAAKFEDAVPEWAKGYIGAAVEKGVIKGYEDNTFRADRLISRAEIAVMVVRALGKGTSDRPLTFSDASDIQAWAAGYVATAADEGIVKGMPGNVFKPAENATRAESSAVVSRLLDALKL